MKSFLISIAAAVLFVSFPVFGGLNDGLVSHWTFDEAGGTTAYDSAGSNNGTIQGNTSRVAGVDGGNALYFNDQRYDYVQGASSPFNFVNTTFTVSAWFKTSYSVFIVSEGCYQREGWGLDCQGPNIHIQTKETGNGYDAYYARTTGHVYNDGFWHQITAVITTSTTTVNGNYAKLYMDGSLVALDEHQAYLYSPSTNNWLIGSLNLTNGDLGSLLKYQGTVDDVRIYNRALTAEEAYQLYATPEPGTLLLLGLGGLFLRRRK